MYQPASQEDISYDNNNNNNNEVKKATPHQLLYFPENKTKKQLNQYGYFTLGAVILVFILAHFIIPRIHQLEGYHNYADKRNILGIPFFFNVMSNWPYLFVGIYGNYLLFFKLRENFAKMEALLFGSFFFFVFLGGFGSAYYHLDPSNFTLCFDRLPLSAAGMSLLCALIAERMSPTLGRNLWFPLIVYSALATTYWGYTESQREGDIRAYAFANFIPAVFIPVILLFFPKNYSGTKYFLLLVIFYALARCAEVADAKIYSFTFNLISGHTIKHLSLGYAVYQICLYVKNRHIIEEKDAIWTDNSENV